MSKILLLGGTGAMGIYLVPKLRELGHEVHITSRTPRKDSDGIKYYLGNAHNLDFLTPLLKKNYDAIIDFMIYSTIEFERRYKLLLDSTNHYIYLSSYRVFDNSKKTIIESSDKLLDNCTDVAYLETDEYALAKARQENILRNSNFVNYTIVRPGITYSSNRFQLGTLEADTIIFRSIHNVPVVFAKEMLEKQTTMTWAGDVAKLLAMLVLNDKAFEQDYNIASSESITWKEVSDIYVDKIGLKLKLINIQDYISVVGGEYQVKYDRMFDRKLDNKKILDITGAKQSEFVSLKDGLSKELEKVMKVENYKVNNWSLQGKMDAITHSRVSINNSKITDKIKYYKSYYLIKIGKML